MGVEFTSLRILVYTLILLLVALLPVVIGISRRLYLTAACLLGARFLRYAWRLFHARDLRLAMPMFKYSITYLFGIFVALIADHCL
jgi:protoheme IX farnesyltransferase